MSFPMTQLFSVELLMFTIKSVDGGLKNAVGERRGEREKEQIMRRGSSSSRVMQL